MEEGFISRCYTFSAYKGGKLLSLGAECRKILFLVGRTLGECFSYRK